MLPENGCVAYCFVAPAAAQVHQLERLIMFLLENIIQNGCDRREEENRELLALACPTCMHLFVSIKRVVRMPGITK